MAQSGEEFANEMARVAAARVKSRSLRPLRSLMPFLRPYRLTIGIAALALICSSTASLLIPPAVRGMIDHGFSRAMAAQIDRFFLPLIAIAGALAVFTAIRFYFV